MTYLHLYYFDQFLFKIDFNMCVTGNESISWPVFQELLSSSWKSVKQSKLEMLASFHIFDINKDGYVDASELKKTLTSMGESLTEEEAEVLLRTADTNGDGKIDYKGKVASITIFFFLSFFLDYINVTVIL